MKQASSGVGLLEYTKHCHHRNMALPRMQEQQQEGICATTTSPPQPLHPIATPAAPKSSPPFKRVLMFVDNAGADIVLGMIPLAREFLRLGAEVGSIPGGARGAPCIRDTCNVCHAPGFTFSRARRSRFSLTFPPAARSSWWPMRCLPSTTSLPQS